MPGEAGRADMIRVWDPLVRLLHWTLAAGFLGAFLLERPRALHEALGWAAVVAVAIRLVWGFAGFRHARFASFVPTPARFLGYARDVLAAASVVSSATIPPAAPWSWRCWQQWPGSEPPAG